MGIGFGSSCISSRSFVRDTEQVSCLPGTPNSFAKFASAFVTGLAKDVCSVHRRFVNRAAWTPTLFLCFCKYETTMRATGIYRLVNSPIERTESRKKDRRQEVSRARRTALGLSRGDVGTLERAARSSNSCDSWNDAGSHHRLSTIPRTRSPWNVALCVHFKYSFLNVL